jgi:hypothetical protein
MKGLNMVMVRNFEVMLGQTLNNSVSHLCRLFYMLNNVREVGGLVIFRASFKLSSSYFWGAYRGTADIYKMTNLALYFCSLLSFTNSTPLKRAVCFCIRKFFSSSPVPVFLLSIWTEMGFVFLLSVKNTLFSGKPCLSCALRCNILLCWVW